MSKEIKIRNYWSTSKLIEIRIILDNIVEKYRKFSKPPQELSLDNAMMTWRGCPQVQDI
jgi:hypothetical protein